MLSASRRQPHLLHVSAVDRRQFFWLSDRKGIQRVKKLECCMLVVVILTGALHVFEFLELVVKTSFCDLSIYSFIRLYIFFQSCIYLLTVDQNLVTSSNVTA